MRVGKRPTTTVAMSVWCLLLGSCGQTTSDDAGAPGIGGRGVSPAGGGSGQVVEYFDGVLPESCEASELRLANDADTIEYDIGYRERLIRTTSWDSFFVYTHTLPLSSGGLIAGWGEGGDHFEDGEVRTLDKTIVFFPEELPTLHCAGGDRLVVASGGQGYLKLSGLSELACGERVEGSLTYCSSAFCEDPAYDSYMLHGTLGGEEKRFVTGGKDYRDSIINLNIGYSFLVASVAPNQADSLALNEGAFLDIVTGELYCIGSIEGTLEEGAIGQVTFSDFRRALPCERGANEPRVEACSEREESTENDP